MTQIRYQTAVLLNCDITNARQRDRPVKFLKLARDGRQHYQFKGIPYDQFSRRFEV